MRRSPAPVNVQGSGTVLRCIVSGPGVGKRGLLWYAGEMTNEGRARITTWLVIACLCLGGFGLGGVTMAAESDGSGAGIFGRQFDGTDAARGASSVLNDTTAGDQRRPSVAVFPEGDFVAVWDAPESGDAGLGIVGRLFDSAGAPLGSELQVNTYTSGNQRRPAVAIDGDGQFVVVWDSSGAQDGAGTGVFAQRFARDGERVGTELQVNSFTTGAQEFAQVAAAGNGFVIVWESDILGSTVAMINGQRFDSAAQPIGTEFHASSYSEDGQRRPTIAAAPDGGFVVVWDSGGQDGGGRGIFARRYNSAGATVGGEIQINSFTTGAQRSPGIAVAADGGFFVVWQSATQDGSGTGIFGQRYNSGGIRIGTEHQINTFTTGDQAEPVVTADAEDFVVAWQSFGDDGESYGIQARRYDANGTGGDVFAVNDDGSGEQTLPAIGSGGDGTVVVWQSRAHCPGDCDDSGAVTVDELVRGVNLALDRAVAFCAAIDPDGDRSVTVDELVRAVNATLAGCPV